MSTDTTPHHIKSAMDDFSEKYGEQLNAICVAANHIGSEMIQYLDWPDRKEPPVKKLIEYMRYIDAINNFLHGNGDWSDLRAIQEVNSHTGILGFGAVGTGELRKLKEVIEVLAEGLSHKKRNSSGHDSADKVRDLAKGIVAIDTLMEMAKGKPHEAIFKPITRIITDYHDALVEKQDEHDTKRFLAILEEEKQAAAARRA